MAPAPVTTGPPTSPGPRMAAAERRALILESARDVFGERGYHGTTTDQIATAAGISQPYVVRMFGSKEKLFLEVISSTIDTLLEAFRAAVAAHRERDGSHDELQRALGSAFIDLVTTRGLHTALLQSFVSGAEPAIGARARDGFLDIYRFLRSEADFSDTEVDSFLGTGMLFSVLLSIQMPSLYGVDQTATDLMETTFGPKCRTVVEAMGPTAGPTARKLPGPDREGRDREGRDREGRGPAGSVDR